MRPRRLSLQWDSIGMEFYMLADSRLVGYSYLTVRPPREIFTTLPFQYMEQGADFTATAPVGDGVLKNRVFLGQSGSARCRDDDFVNLRGARSPVPTSNTSPAPGSGA